MELAEQPPKGRKAFPVTSNAFESSITADMTELFEGRIFPETIRLLEDFSQRGLTGHALADAIADGLKDLSPIPVERVARASATEAFNLGRNLAAQPRQGQIAQVVRTAILDVDTCTEEDYGDGLKRCRELDGFSTTVNGPGYFEHMPPNDCEGRGNCRCFYLYLKEAA